MPADSCVEVAARISGPLDCSWTHTAPYGPVRRAERLRDTRGPRERGRRPKRVGRTAAGGGANMLGGYKTLSTFANSFTTVSTLKEVVRLLD